MGLTILLTGAGGGGTNNLIRDLRKVNNSVTVIGSNIDKYQVAKSIADRTYLLPVATDTEKYLSGMNEVIDKEKISLVIPNNDREVKALSDNRERLKAKLFLPSKEAVDICQDKWVFYKMLSAAGIPMAETHSVTSLGDIDDIFKRMSSKEILWCRMRTGSGSKGATQVKTPEQARFWITYWNEMRGVPVDKFTISEFLPGRDLCVQSTWKNGNLKIMKMIERLSYYGGDARPSGMSSTPQVAKTVRENDALEVCLKVAKLVDKNPNGNFNFDFKQNSDGVFCLTEVNIGRFCMITPIFDLTGKYNMIDSFIKLAFDEELAIDDPFDIDEEKYLIRELDTEPLILSGKEMEKRVQTVRG